MIICSWRYVHTDVDICLMNWLRIRQAKLILFDIETRWRSRQRFCVVTLHIGDNFFAKMHFDFSLGNLIQFYNLMCQLSHAHLWLTFKPRLTCVYYPKKNHTDLIFFCNMFSHWVCSLAVLFVLPFIKKT